MPLRNSALLRPPRRAPTGFRNQVAAAMDRLPPLEGQPVRLRLIPELRVYRRRLGRGPGPGTAVHAGSDLRRRITFLDQSLVADRAELVRILYHEIFHYAWVRLSNGQRHDYEAILARELHRRARGELGWSAELRKRKLAAGDVCHRSRRWREYVCESFCDTAAWIYAGRPAHPEATLAPGFQAARIEWFRGFPRPGHRIVI